ncbi:hypothetical protein SAMN05444166_8482 [Singulisphaera sp. GP187]|nr:hypothetical protein SAMN05444166_8482 [Singulisphaera sp. GP187]
MKQQSEMQASLLDLLRQVQHDNATLLNAHWERSNRVDRELAALRAEFPPLPHPFPGLSVANRTETSRVPQSRRLDDLALRKRGRPIETDLLLPKAFTRPVLATWKLGRRAQKAVQTPPSRDRSEFIFLGFGCDHGQEFGQASQSRFISQHGSVPIDRTYLPAPWSNATTRTSGRTTDRPDILTRPVVSPLQRPSVGDAPDILCPPACAQPTIDLRPPRSFRHTFRPPFDVTVSPEPFDVYRLIRDDRLSGLSLGA